MTKRALQLFSLILFIIACKAQKKEAVRTEKVIKETEAILSPEEQKGIELLDKCLEAHGGMRKWNSFEGLQYNLSDNGKMV